MKTCTDCKEDGRTVTLLFDKKQMGDVCTRCGRVFSPLLGRNQKHYATEADAKRSMRRDKDRELHGEYTAGLVDRILHPEA